MTWGSGLFSSPCASGCENRAPNLHPGYTGLGNRCVEEKGVYEIALTH